MLVVTNHGVVATAPDALLERTLTHLRWVMVGALLILSISQPLTGRVGLPTWVLILIFAAYNWGISGLRRYLWVLRPLARISIADLVVVGALYSIGASPSGVLFVLFLLITICAAATIPLPWSLLYTSAVILVMALISPTLPLWPSDVGAIRDLLARLVVVALVSTITVLLVRRLEHEHEDARAHQETAERERELNRLRDIFVSSVSHDLRTPLTALRAGLGMLELSATDRLRHDEARLLAAARRNSERLILLIDDLLTYNQMEAGVLHLSCVRLDLGHLVNEVLSALQPLLDEKGQSVTVDVTDPLPIEGDARRLEQALVNVLANAHQHTPAETHIHVSAEATAQHVVLTVRDDGPGIPAEDLDRAFQRFQRLDGAGGGSGLGLAIARSIVERHSGRLWAESDCGQGTAFHLMLPRCESGGALCP